MNNAFMTGQNMQTASGEYIGDGQTTFSIKFPFVPTIVHFMADILTTSENRDRQGYYIWGGSTFAGSAYTPPMYTVTVSGSTITMTRTSSSNQTMNANGVLYRWVAIG